MCCSKIRLKIFIASLKWKKKRTLAAFKLAAERPDDRVPWDGCVRGGEVC